MHDQAAQQGRGDQSSAQRFHVDSPQGRGSSGEHSSSLSGSTHLAPLAGLAGRVGFGGARRPWMPGLTLADIYLRFPQTRGEAIPGGAPERKTSDDPSCLVKRFLPEGTERADDDVCAQCQQGDEEHRAEHLLRQVLPDMPTEDHADDRRDQGGERERPGPTVRKLP